MSPKTNTNNKNAYKRKTMQRPQQSASYRIIRNFMQNKMQISADISGRRKMVVETKYE